MNCNSRDTDPGAHRIQVELLRKAGNARRAALALAWSQRVIELSRRAIRRRHPEWSERRVRLEFVALHYGPELAEQVRRYLERRYNERPGDPAGADAGGGCV